jgi:hypothetical protein
VVAVLLIGFGTAQKAVDPAPIWLAFTLAPHLQPINYRGCFSPFIGI